jgi:hypothetical protein
MKKFNIALVTVAALLLSDQSIQAKLTAVEPLPVLENGT